MAEGKANGGKSDNKKGRGMEKRQIIRGAGEWR